VSSLPAKIATLLKREGGVVLRYLVTSGINVIDHQVLLQLAVRWWEWGGGEANVFASLVSVIPAYLLSRYWVWQVRGRPSLRNEVIPFWVIALLGLLSSTVTAEAADRLFERPIMISAGSLLGYFVVWILKFIVLSFMFARSAADAERVPVA
jgi:putative flippase GtrA